MVFYLVDVVAALTESVNPMDYLKKLRKRDEQLRDYIGTNCPQVAMSTETGKARKTWAATTRLFYAHMQDKFHFKKLLQRRSTGE